MTTYPLFANCANCADVNSNIGVFTIAAEAAFIAGTYPKDEITFFHAAVSTALRAVVGKYTTHAYAAVAVASSRSTARVISSRTRLPHPTKRTTSSASATLNTPGASSSARSASAVHSNRSALAYASATSTVAHTRARDLTRGVTGAHRALGAAEVATATARINE